MIKGAYFLDLHCDGREIQRDHPLNKAGVADAKFSSQSIGECLREARKIGWTIDSRKGLAFCPNCRQLDEAKKARRQNRPIFRFFRREAFPEFR